MTLKKGGRGFASTLPPFTERSTMNIHSHKEPPLQDKVNHKEDLLSRLYLFVSAALFTVMLALTFAGVFE